METPQERRAKLEQIRQHRMNTTTPEHRVGRMKELQVELYEVFNPLPKLNPIRTGVVAKCTYKGKLPQREQDNRYYNER